MKKTFPKVITATPTGSCYRICRKAIKMLEHNSQGIIKSSFYVYKAVKVKHKNNTALVTRCYRDYFKEPEYPGKWQVIGDMPIDPTKEYG